MKLKSSKHNQCSK